MIPKLSKSSKFRIIMELKVIMKGLLVLLLTLLHFFTAMCVASVVDEGKMAGYVYCVYIVASFFYVYLIDHKESKGKLMKQQVIFTFINLAFLTHYMTNSNIFNGTYIFLDILLYIGGIYFILYCIYKYYIQQREIRKEVAKYDEKGGE